MTAPSYGAPYYLRSGSEAAVTSADATPGLPTGQRANDILIMHAQVTRTASLAITANNTAGHNGWENLSTLDVDATTAATDDLLSYIWITRVTNSATLAAPTLTRTGGDYTLARMYGVRGVSTVGTATSTVDASNHATSSLAGVNTLSWNDITTTVLDTFIIGIAQTGADIAGLTHGSLTTTTISDLRERFDTGTTSGGGGTYYVVTGIKETAGAVGVVTAVPQVGTRVYAKHIIALKPNQVTAPTVAVVTPSSGATSPSTTWVVDVTGPHGNVMVTQASTSPEVVHDGSNFVGFYSSCSRAAITDGYRYTLARRTGWLGLPTFSATYGGI